MASKYLSMEQAAAQLGISTEELNSLREKGDVRGFADRGAWKFRGEDIEELGRTMEPDSGFDIPFTDDDSVIEEAAETGSQIILEEDEVGDLPTTISKQPANRPPSSDSDVRLVIDPSFETEPNEDVARRPAATDSDVRLVDDSLSDKTDTPSRISADDDSIDLSNDDDDFSGISDSDVRLAPVSDDDDSDVTLKEDSAILGGGDLDETDSEFSLQDDSAIGDSDVTLIGVDDDPDASGVRLTGTDHITQPGSDISLQTPGDDSEIRLDESSEDDDSILSDIMSEPASGLSFSSGDSGISLDLSIDSGISLDSDDDDDDSLTLAPEDEEGSSIMGPDSGISLVPDMGSGLSLADDDDEAGGATIPMMETVDDDEDDTSFDMPMLEDSEAELETDDADTGVVMFDDDDDADTMEFDSSELSGAEEFDFDDDEGSFDELSEGDMDLSDELLSDDDVLDVDDTFDDEFESGQSVPALSVPGGVRGAGGAVAAEWDMLSFALVLVSTIMMGLCVMLMFDLVRSMWGFAEPNGVNGMILDTLNGIIGS